MYTQFFKFKEKPFNLSPKPSVFHENSGIYTAYQFMLDGIRTGEKLILLTGDTGTGKTLCAQKLLADLEKSPNFCDILIPHTSLPFDEMLDYICVELNLKFGLGENNDKLEILEMFLAHGVSQIRSVVIVIDEAQNLEMGVFDGLLDLLKSGQKAKRDIQIVVLARNESDLKLNQPQMASFNHEISLRCHLQALKPEETISYIKFQLETAGAAYSDIFTEEAARKVYDLTQGRARAINVLCDHALIVAANDKETIITADHVNNAHQQQKFDDTIEMRTSLISDAIDRYVNEKEPESVIKTDPVLEPETQEITEPDIIEPLIPKTSVTEEPAPISFASRDKPALSGGKEPAPASHDDRFVRASGRRFGKFALVSLAVLSIAGLIYYQIQQQKIIADLENKITDMSGDTIRSEPVVTIAEDKMNDQPFAADQHEIKNVGHDMESGKAGSSARTPPVNQTVYLDQDQQLADQPPSTQIIQKPALDEGKGVTNIDNQQEPRIATKDTITAPVSQNSGGDSKYKSSEKTIVEEQSDSAIEQLLSIAKIQIGELKLTNPKGDNALESYQQILGMEPENERAIQGIASLKEMFLTWAENNKKKNRIDRTQNYYKKALLIDPEDLDIQQKLSELEQQTADQESDVIKSGLLGLAKEENAKGIKTLLAKGADPDIQDKKGNTPLMLASDRGYLDVVLALLSGDANPNLKNKAGDTALINAVWNNNVQIADQLLQKRAKVNAANNRGWTPLMYAAIHGHVQLFQKLINNGADLESRTDDQKTALSIAAHNGQREIVSLLLQNGAKVNTTDKDNWTPLMHAVWNNHATVVQILLLNDSDVNHKNSEGWTPLMLASWNGYEPIVEMLLEKGADKSIKNPDGNTAFDLASEQQHYSIVALLR